jgi:hypothetical protein
MSSTDTIKEMINQESYITINDKKYPVIDWDNI